MISSRQKIVCIIFLLFSYGIGWSQNAYVDSLRTELVKPGMADTVKFELLISLGNALSQDSPALSRRQYQLVDELASRAHNAYYRGMAMSGLGKLNDPQNYDSARYYYHLADSFFALDPSVGALESRATNKASIAQIERQEGHFESALKIYFDGVDILEKSTAYNKWLALGILYSNIGGVYHDLHQFGKGLEYDLKAAEAYGKQKSDPAYAVVAELYVAGDYKDMGLFNEARKHLERGQALVGSSSSPDLNYRLQNAWGSFYQKTGALNDAQVAYSKAMVYARTMQDDFRIMNCNRMLGFILRDLGKFGQSASYLQAALAGVRSLKNPSLEQGVLKALAEVETRQGHADQALAYYKSYIDLSDSLNEDETRRRIAEIENRYQAEKKQDSILVLQKNNLIQADRLKQEARLNWALIVGCALLFLVAALLFMNVRHRKGLYLQKARLHAQEISRLENEKRLLAAQSLMKGQEEERTRLARDLHDGVGGLLSGVKLGMSSMKGNVILQEESALAFDRVIGQLDQSISELRRVSHNMMPEALIKYGLKEALENYCENLNVSGAIRVQLQTYGMEQRIQQDAEIVIYRVVQELLNNVVRHASARQVLVQLVREGDRFNLTVEDDGRGFHPDEVKEGTGLANIKARIDYLNGDVDVSSTPGGGTSVHIEGECV